MQPLSLYLHIPFCKQKCLYCDFPSFSGQDAFYQTYTDALCRELAHKARLAENASIQTVFVGGGTPTLLPKEHLQAIMSQLYTQFSIAPDAEITIEANPKTISSALSPFLLSLGFNRISLGVQAFDDRLLAALGRIHSRRDALDTFFMLRQDGFKNINLDLMFSLPGQTLANWQETLETAISLEPEHLSCYSLIVEEGTPFYEKQHSGTLALPDEETDRQMYQLANSLLQKAGYRRYEISNFARVGAECRHNIVYWQDESYLGFGLGAHSYYNGIRYHNPYALDAYIKAGGNPPREDVEQLSTAQKQAEFMFMGLRMTDGISEQRFYDRFQSPVGAVFEKPLARLTTQGLLVKQDGRIFLTPYGTDISNYVFEQFLPDV